MERPLNFPKEKLPLYTKETLTRQFALPDRCRSAGIVERHEQESGIKIIRTSRKNGRHFE